MKTNTLPLTIAMAQMEIAQHPMENAAAFLAAAKKAAVDGAQIVVAPEMMLGHYVSGDRYEDDAFIDEMWVAAMHIVEASKDINAVLVFGGIGLDEDVAAVGEDGRRRKYNVAFVAQQGRLLKNKAGLPFVIKALLPNYRIFDDARHFYDLRKVALERGVTLASLQQPFVVHLEGQEYSLGVMLCEDMWDIDYAQKPAENLAKNGADVLINISASPWSWQKNRKRDQVIRNICQKTGLPFVYVNNVGAQNNGKNFIVFDGASTVYNSAGEIVAMTPRYEVNTELVVLDAVLAPLARPKESDIAELYTAISVATRGFLETLPKSVASKVVIGVSGGMDSALSVAFFAKLLGPENVLAVNMPYGNFNSKETRDDAAKLCENLGVRYQVIAIDPMVDARAAVAGIEVGSSQHKTAQAIERMSVIAAVAGQEGAFFTSNANMTEIAFGYGTLNGDMRGTFAPWMNCLKQDVYRLGVYLNEVVYGREVIPQSIIVRPPMDELTAQGAGERKDPFDYGSVKENGYHDQMVRALVAFRRSPLWFLEQYITGTLEAELKLSVGKLESLFPTSAAFVEDLERCVRLFHGAVFKRVQSVPGPLVDKRSFGWDLRESILPVIETEQYKKVREEILAK